MTQPSAAIIIIGNEILSGRTQDKNIAYIAQGLTAKGIQLSEVRIIRDDKETIINVVNQLRQQYDYVFTSGGIGPTHDDITSESIAAAFNVALLRHPEAVRRLEEHYRDRTEDLNEARLRMANIPDGGTLIDNPVSAAPGFKIENLYVFAGVPVILQAMFDNILPTLNGGEPILSRTITADITEGNLAEPLGKLQEQWPNVEIGSYPFIRNGKLGVSIVLRSTSEDTLIAAAEDVSNLVQTYENML